MKYRHRYWSTRQSFQTLMYSSAQQNRSGETISSANAEASERCHGASDSDTTNMCWSPTGALVVQSASRGEIYPLSQTFYSFCVERVCNGANRHDRLSRRYSSR